MMEEEQKVFVSCRHGRTTSGSNNKGEHELERKMTRNVYVSFVELKMAIKILRDCVTVANRDRPLPTMQKRTNVTVQTQRLTYTGVEDKTQRLTYTGGEEADVNLYRWRRHRG